MPLPTHTSPVASSEVLLSILIPCYNETSTVEGVVAALRALPLRTQIICIDDASTDGTRTVLRHMEASGAIDVLFIHPHNQGKGAAIRTGRQAVTGDVVIVQDADGEYDPTEIPMLIHPILAGKADAVFGSRFRSSHPRRVLYFWHTVGNKALTLISNLLTNLNLTDIETGYKAIRADLFHALTLKSNRFGIEPELTARLARPDVRIYEVGISYTGRTYAEGKKIHWRDGLAALWHLLRFNVEERMTKKTVSSMPPFAQMLAMRKSSTEHMPPTKPPDHAQSLP